jgi:hypothetical protein
MNPQKKRRSRVVEVGKGPAKVRIYTITRKDGYPQFTLNWKEGGRRRTRCLACMDEARMIAQQTSLRLTNAWHATDEATKRDIDVLRHCEGLAGQFGVTLVAAMEEWLSARKTAEGVTLSDAVRFYAANRTDLLPSKTVAQVAAEFVQSLRNKGVSAIYVRSCKLHLKGFSAKVTGNIADVTVADVNRYLNGRKTLGPVSKNGISQVQLENELRQGLANIGESLRAAIDAARTHVTLAAGGAQAVEKSTLARRHLSLLTRYSSPLPASETIRLRLGLLEAAWQVIDAAISSLDEIRFDARRGA